MTGSRTKGLFAATVAALLVCAPSPAAARVTVSVEIAYGAVAVGGVGIVVFVSGSWDLAAAGRDLPTALVELNGGEARLGVPIPVLSLEPACDDGVPPSTGVRVDLVRWRF